MPMKFASTGGGVDFPPIASGTHVAICNIVAGLGLQPGSAMYPKPKRQIVVRFELPQERVEYEKDGKKLEGPAVITKTYTASMGEKANLRHDLESWRGRAFTDEEAADFDVSSILGKPCVISITHKQKENKTYANITSVGKAMKGTEKIVAECPLIYYNEDDGNTKTYAQLPDWIKKKIDEQIKEKPPAADQQQQTGNQLDDGSYITDDDLPPEFDPDSVPF